MKRTIKWFLLAAATIAIAAVVTVELIDWNFLKPRIEAQVQAATGRDLSIDGDVEVELLPRPRIMLNDVALANPAWAGTAHFIELDRLRVAPDLLALATGRLAFARIDVDAPVVRLVDRPESPANWVLEREVPVEAEPIPVHRLSVTNADVRYRPAVDGRTTVLRIPSLQLRDDGATADVRGTAMIREREIGFEADIDSLFAREMLDESFDGELRIASAESRLESEFAFSRPSFPAEWRVRLEADIADVDRWIDLFPGIEPIGIGSVVLRASLARSGSTWKAEDVHVTAMKGSLRGDLAVDTADEVPEVSGSIRSGAIDVDALRKLLPGEKAPAATTDSIAPPPLLPRLAGSIAVDIEQIAGLAVPIGKATARLRFGAHRLAIEELELSVLAGTVRGAADMTSAPDAVSADLELAFEELSTAEEAEERRTLSGEVDVRLAPVARDRWDREAIARGLVVEAAKIDYANPEASTRLSATGRLVGEASRPGFELAGTLGGRPLDAEIEGAGLAGAWPGPGYRLNGRATSDSLALTVETTLGSVLNLERFDGRVSLAGDGANDLDPWLAIDLLPTPPFRISGRLKRDERQWSAEGLEAEIGESRLRGAVQVDVDERPRITAALEADPLDLGWLATGSDDAGAGRASGEGSGTGPGDLGWLRAFDADLQLGATAARLPGWPELGGLELKAELERGAVHVQRFGVRIAGGTFSMNGTVDATGSPASARIDARFDDIALGRLGETFSPLEERLGLLSGNLHTVVTRTLADAYRDDVIAPMIGRLKIEPSELRFADAEAGTDLRFGLRTEGLADGEQRFRLNGNGRYDGDPVSLEYRSDALLDIRLPDRPYAVDLDARVVDTRIELDGTLLRPLSLEGLDLQLALDGPNPQRLSRILGVPLPDLPPYDVAGRLGLEQQRWSLSDLDGTVGDSDLRGRLAFDVAASPPALTGELRSDLLDIDDLAGIAGAEPEAGDGEAEQSDRFVLPDDPLIGEAWREVTADVRYRGGSVRAGDVPLSDLVIDFDLRDGTARFEPVGFGVGDGNVDFVLELDATRSTPEGTLSVEVRAVDLREALSDWGLADESVGIVAAQGKFWVTGESIAALLGSADGGLVMLMTEGRLEALLVELAGLDASQAFLSWIGGRAGIPINCAYVDLKSRDGLVQVDTFVIDTEDTIFTVGGRVNLDDERLDLSVVAHPQDASVLVGRTPFHFGGTFGDIDAGIHGGELGLRLGASAGLAALAGPLAALVPLLEAGVDDRTGYCQGLVERTRQAIETGKDNP